MLNKLQKIDWKIAALSFILFWNGASVMAFEITGSRMMAPYIGTSQIIWTSLIGVVLISLSIGNWYGGKLADKSQSYATLSKILVVSGILVLCTALTNSLLLTTLSEISLNVIYKSLIAGVVLLAPASTVIGLVSPYTTRMLITSVDTSGALVGRVGAIGSLGSILGTFAAGFWLLPSIGTLRTQLLIAISLIAIGLILVPRAFTQARAAVLIALLSTLPISYRVDAAKAEIGIIEKDTQYARAQIENVTWIDGRPIKLLKLDGQYSSAIYTDTKSEKDSIVFDYIKYWRLDRYFTPVITNSLMIGGAGYTFATEYLQQNPSATLDVVEIDSGVTELARTYFNVPTSPSLRIYTEDGRTFVNRTPTKLYDTIYLDAFSSVYTTPFQLTTLEAAKRYSAILQEDGTILVNAIGALTGPQAEFVEALVSTYREVFPFVKVFPVQFPEEPGTVQNLSIILRKSMPSIPYTTSDELLSYLKNEYLQPITQRQILTDDKAPVERYTSKML